jgi:hypothetical protein
MKFLSLSLIAVSFSLNAYAARLCGAGGADPLDCKSGDGKYEIWISEDKNLTGLGISTGAFCDHGYVKVEGIELNGPEEKDDSTKIDYGTDFVEAVTSELGIKVNNEGMHKVMIPKTVVGFTLTDAAVKSLAGTKAEGANVGHALVFSDNSAYLYVGDGRTEKTGARLTCK